MERYEPEEKSIQGSQEINNKHQPTLSQVNKSTRADEHKSQS